jgi:hypothetical protein
MTSLGHAPPPPPPIRPTAAQALVTLFGGLLLAGGSCAGFLTTLNFNGGSDSVNTVFAIGFILSLVVAVVGVVLVIVRVVRLLVRRRGEQQGTPPDPR